jgi:hypothetical protein
VFIQTAKVISASAELTDILWQSQASLEVPQGF